jgi:hypothetical protein
LQLSLSIAAISASRAFAKAAPVFFPIAPCTRGVTSVIEVTTSACWPAQVRSSLRLTAVKPSLARSFSFVESCCTQFMTQ